MILKRIKAKSKIACEVELSDGWKSFRKWQRRADMLRGWRRAGEGLACHNQDRSLIGVGLLRATANAGCHLDHMAMVYFLQ